MKSQTSTILVACLAIVMSNNFGMGVEVSSMVDLDSDESEETLSNATLDTIVDQDESTGPLESVLRTPKPVVIGGRRGSGLVKASEPRKRRIYSWHDATVKQPKIINNIHIVVNGNDSVPSATKSCKRSVCNVSVSSESDENGNIVTEVHLSIVTSAESDNKIDDDVPVIDGLRGLGKNHDEHPVFSVNTPKPVYSHLHRENIPQIQVNYQGYGEPWYQHRRIFQRPRGYWSYNSAGFRGYNTRPRPIDDKIGPPLSKTKASDTVK
ncbi:hypothetical protein DMN91_012922 [Ooceraea biroi]|uniref:Uncharacterized protein n=1 Tax=Ooceraea biroi TaxID=2015173 RepID=A0A026WZ27_OOCBI|nr:hypothetical protein X777_11989 [Ooceraea biroi]RLU15035.1 hypothetical protein DMN91_012922 [Ooceraea biroi]